jgi:hypothetical protein
MLNYRAYVTNGFNGAGYTSAGLRGGRQRGIQARAAQLAFSGRVDLTPTAGVTGGLGLYQGGAGQEQVVLDGAQLEIGTTIIEAHGQAQVRGFDLRALVARASVDQAAATSRALRLPLNSPVADEMLGGYVQLGYNVLSQVATPLALTPYLRYESVDTQHRVPTGYTRDLSRDTTLRTLGIELKPIPNVVVKTDYQWISNQAGTGRNQFNINLGYAF